MATFRAGKLARKKNSRFQSTAVKSRTENVLDSRKRKSSDSLADAIKVSFRSECESETVLSGRRVVELGLLSKELADGCNYCRCPLQLLEGNCIWTWELSLYYLMVRGKKVFLAITRRPKIVSSGSRT